MATDPNKLWSSMTPEQQASFQAKNPTFNTSMLSAPVNKETSAGTYTSVAGGGFQQAPTMSTPIKPQESQTPATYNPNVYGDLGGAASKKGTTAGLGTSTGATYQAPTEIKYTPISQNLNYWGNQAVQKLTGNQFAERNDQTAMNLVTQGKTKKEDVELFLRSQPGYTTATPEQQMNTVQAVMNRIGDFTAQQQPPVDEEARKKAQIEANFNKEMNIANLRGEGEISEALRQMYNNQYTIDEGREKFANWDETQRKVQGAIDAIARNKKLEADKGMQPTSQLTETDIQAAMDATGLTREEVTKVSSGSWTDWLQWNDKYAKENLTKDFDRWTEDTTAQKERTLQDMTTQLNELKQTVSWQIQDITEKVTQNVQGAEKIGALKGFNRSGGYLDGIMKIKDEGIKLINRLQTQLTQAENADAKIRGRLMEDFGRNLSRAKFDLDQQMSDLKNKTAIDLGNLQSKFSLGSPQMEVAINDLLEKSMNYSNTALLNYGNAMKSIYEQKNSELDLIEKQENQWLNKIKQVETAITAGGGQVLMNMNVNDIKGYVQQGMNPDVARQMRDAMVSKTISSFTGLSNEDKQTVENLIDKGSSPMEVMAFLQSQGKQTNAAGLGEFKDVYVNGKRTTFVKDPVKGWIPFRGTVGGGVGGGGGGGYSSGKTITPTATPVSTNDILSQTGLSVDAFAYLTQGNTALTRMSEKSRAKVKQEAQNFLSRKGVDISTFKSQYDGINDAIQRAIKIQSNVQRDELEIEGTMETLKESVKEEDLSRVKKANLVKIALGQEVNDEFAYKYGFLLSTLREEMAGYYAALRGDNMPNESDSTRAAQLIANGISEGGLNGLNQGFENNVKKLAVNLPKNVEKLNAKVRDLFGVGGNYKMTEEKKETTQTGGTKISSYKPR